jgi:hypothetical protein
MLTLGRIICCSIIVSCGSAPEPKPVAPSPVASPEPAASAPTVRQELGDIDEDALKRTLAGLQGELRDCLERARARLVAIGGDATLMLRVGEDGHLRHAYFQSSTLGDRDSEKCVLDAFARGAWPKPRGGDAEVRHDFTFEEGADRAAEWAGEDPGVAISHHKTVRPALDRCRKGVAGTFRVTAYAKPVEGPNLPSGAAKRVKQRGPRAKQREVQLVAIGVAPPNAEGEERVDCIVEALREVRLVAPTASAPKLAKLKFLLP